MSRIDEIRARLAERGTLVGSLAFAQHAPADIAWLLAEVERLTRERDAADAQTRAWASKIGAALDDAARLVPVADAEAVAAATAAERERCARVCEGWAREGNESGYDMSVARACAAAIRRGGE